MSETGPPDSATLVAGDHGHGHDHEHDYDHDHKLQQQRPPPEEHVGGVDNPAFQDNGDLRAPHDGAAVVLGSYGGLADLRLDGELKDKEVTEAVNLELVNMNPNNGSGNGLGLNGIPVKKEPGEDPSEGYADPYDEYFVPVNEHRKYMSTDRPRITFVLPESASSGVNRAGLSLSEPLEGVVDYHEWMQKSARGEKLYVTKDKRRSQSWGRLILMGICCVVVAAAIVIGALAATGVILSQQEAIVGDAAMTSRQFSGSASPVLDEGSNDVLPEVSSYSPPPDISREPDSPPSTEMNQYYLPRVLEGEFVIDNMEFDPKLERRDSYQFKTLASSLEEELKNALFDYQTLHYGAADISMKVLQFSPGSVVVKFRLGWQFKAGLRNPRDPIQKDDIRRKLEDHLQLHDGYLESYHVSSPTLRAGYTVDMCQFNNGQCSNDCIFDYQTLDFICICPHGYVLDTAGKNCSIESHEPENEIQEKSEQTQEVAHPNIELNSPETNLHTDVSVAEQPYSTIAPVAEPHPSTDAPVAEPHPSTDAPVAKPYPSTDAPVAEPHLSTDAPVAEPQPSTDAPVAEPQPSTDAPVAEPQPSTDAPVAEPQPSTDAPVAEPQPSTDAPVAEPHPSTDAPVAEPHPSTDAPVAEPQPSTAVPVAEPQPSTAVPVAEPQPSTDAPVAEPQPSTDAPVAEPQPNTDAPVAEPQPNTDAPVAEPQPSTDAPVAEPHPSTDAPVAEPHPSTDAPVAEPHPSTDAPVAEPQPITEIPTAEQRPSTNVPVAEPQPITEVPVAEPQPITEVPVAEPQPITEVPVAEPQPITEVPVAEPQPITEVPVAEPQPITEVPVAEPQPITEVPVAEPQPITEVPVAEPQPSTEVPLSKPVSGVEFSEIDLSKSNNYSHAEVLSSTEQMQMGLQPVLSLQHESNQSSEVESLPTTDIPNDVPVGREMGQYHSSGTEYPPVLSVTSGKFGNETNSTLDSIFNTVTSTHFNSSNSLPNDVDIDNSEINKISEVVHKQVDDNNYKVSQDTGSHAFEHFEQNTSEISETELPATTEVLHANFENNTGTHSNENELDLDYQIGQEHNNNNYFPHSLSEISGLETEEMTTSRMVMPEVTVSTEVLPATTEVLHFVEDASENVVQEKGHETFFSSRIKVTSFNTTKEFKGRQKLSRMENGEENISANGMPSDVNTTLSHEPSDVKDEHNITSDMMQSDDNTQMVNNIDEFRINETSHKPEMNVQNMTSHPSDGLGHDNHFTDENENNLNYTGNNILADNATMYLNNSAQNNATVLAGKDDDDLKRKALNERDPASQLMHTLVYGDLDSSEALNDTFGNETNAEHDEKFRNIIEEPGFVLVNLTKESDIPESFSVTNSSLKDNESPASGSGGEHNLGSNVSGNETTTDMLQNNGTQSLAEDSENHIKNTLSSEEDEHNLSTFEDNHNISVPSKEDLKKRPTLDDDEILNVNPHEKNRTQDVDETVSPSHPTTDIDNSNVVSDDTIMDNTSEAVELPKTNETFLHDKVLKDVTGPSNYILSDQSNSEVSQGVIENKEMSSVNKSDSEEVNAPKNKNRVSVIAGANTSSGENDIDDIWNDNYNLTKQNSSHFPESNSSHEQNLQTAKVENVSSNPEFQLQMQNETSANAKEHLLSIHLNASTPHDFISSNETTVAENDLLPVVEPSDGAQGQDNPLAVIPIEETLKNDFGINLDHEVFPTESNGTVNIAGENVTEFAETSKITPMPKENIFSSTKSTDTTGTPANLTNYNNNNNNTEGNSWGTLSGNNVVTSENLTEGMYQIGSGPESINIVSQQGSSVGSEASYAISDSKVPEAHRSENFTSNESGKDLHKFLAEDLENKLVNHVETKQVPTSTTEHFGSVSQLPPSSDGNMIPPTSGDVSHVGVKSIIEDTSSVNGSTNPQASPIDETVLVDKAASEELVDKTEVKKKDLSSAGNIKKINKATDTSSTDDEDSSNSKLANGIFDKKGKYEKDSSRKVEKLGLSEVNEDVTNISRNSDIGSTNLTVSTVAESPKITEEQSAVDVQDENENALHVISDTNEGINTVGGVDVKESKREKKKSDKTTTKETAPEKVLKTPIMDTSNGSTVNMTTIPVMPEKEVPFASQKVSGLAASSAPPTSSEQGFSVQESSIPATTLAKENVIDSQPSANGVPELLPTNGELPRKVAAQMLKVEEENSMRDTETMGGGGSSSSTNSLTEQHTEPSFKDSVIPEMATRLDDVAVRTVSTMPTITANDFAKLLADVGIVQVNGSTQEASSVTFSKCAAGQFQCTNGTSREGAYCVSLSAKCDSINDCSDGSDEAGCMEEGCPGNFQCASGQCLKRHLVCNGIIDCDDRSDEVDCDKWKCLFDEFQCPSGRCIPVLWQCDGKPDCVNHTDEYNCQSTCGNDEFLCPELWCIPMTWRCNGQPECANGEDEKLCDCTLDQFKCHTGGCIRGSQVCDGVEHCPDSSDEWNCLKIQKDTNSLQIRSPDGPWQSVCGDSWNGNLSDLVCRELGYSKAVFTDLAPQTQDNSTAMYYTVKSGTDALPSSHQPSLLTLMDTSPECQSSSTVELSCQEFSCGIHSSADGMAARLVGGDRASSGQWPSVALMYHTSYKSSCTASIISPVWLLTSYNCLKSKDKTLLPDMWVVFGGGSMFDIRKPDRQIREVQAIIPHPQVKFNQFVYNNNLALVKLANPFMLTRYVSAVCLPEEEIEPRQLCVTAGWSYAAPGEINFSPYLNYLPIPTIELDTCNSTKHYAGYIETSDICAGFMDSRKSPCYNDEGAPLMCISEGGVWELQGVLSYHSNCGRGEHPAIFSSVGTSRDWIEHTIGTHFEHKTAFNVRRR